MERGVGTVRRWGWVALATGVLLVAAARADDGFILSVEGPDMLCGDPGSAQEHPFFVVLHHHGEGDGARAWTYALELDQPAPSPGRPRLELVDITIEGTDAGELNQGQAVDSRILDDHRAISSVVMTAGDDWVSFPPELPVAGIARLTVRVTFPEAGDDVPETSGGWDYLSWFRFLPELDAPTGLVETIVYQGDRPYVPELEAKAVPTCETPPPLRAPEGSLFVNCAGEEEVQDRLLRVWIPDTPFLRPHLHPTERAELPEGAVDRSLLEDPYVPAEVLGSTRWCDGEIHYQIPVLHGPSYRVVLYFAETLPDDVGPALGGTGCPDCARWFDVDVEGQRVEGYNVADEAAGAPDDGEGAVRTATALAFEVEVLDGFLDLRIIDRGEGNPPGNALIQAFAVTALVPPGPPVEEPPPREWPMLEGVRLAIDPAELKEVFDAASPAPVTGFIRGDCNGDGQVFGGVTDAIVLLSWLFLGAEEPPCIAACDANGDGSATAGVTDAIYLLSHLFLGGPEPPPPFPECGPPTDVDLESGCRTPRTCGEGPGGNPALFTEWLSQASTDDGSRLEELLAGPRAEILASDPEVRGRLLTSLYLELSNLPLAWELPPPDPGNEPRPPVTLADAVDMTPHVALGEELAGSVDFRDDLVKIPLKRQHYLEPTSPSAPPLLEEVSHVIYAGDLPPNYVHTWALDLVGIDAFKLGFDSLSDITLSWPKPGAPPGTGDRITVLNSCGEVLSAYQSLYAVQTEAIQMKTCQWDQGLGSRRVYVILETGSEAWKGRRFALRHLRKTTVASGAEKAIVLADRLNYETAEKFVVARDASGIADALYPPWGHNPNSSWPWKNPKQKDAQGELVEEGWYLIGENLTTYAAKKKFYALVYYNDIQSKLRVYLLNKGTSTDATYHELEIALVGRSVVKQNASGTTNSYQTLSGAFFPVDADPAHWSQARVALAHWEQNEWTMTEVPFLYPMTSSANDLLESPSLSWSTVHGEPVKRYHSLYEERFKQNLRNVMVRLTVRGVTTGTMDGTAVGKAIGDAVESYTQSGDPSPFASFEQVYEGIKKGKEWYDSAEDFFKKAEPVLENQASFDKVAKYLVSGGASMASGFVGMAGFAVSVLSDLLADDPKPLQLAIELAMDLKLSASYVSKGTGQSVSFYLPGRCSIQDAFRDIAQGGEGLSKGDRAYIDGLLPRFSRPLGLFGFRYDPSRIVVDVERDRRIWKGVLEIVFPRATTGSVSNVLPVVYNPYAFITPLWSQPEIAAFDNDDFLWTPCGPIVGDFCKRSDEVRETVLSADGPMQYRKFVDRVDPTVGNVDHGFHLKGGTDDWMLAELTGVRPLHDVMCYWEIAYRYRGPSRILKVVLVDPPPLVWKLGESSTSQSIDPDPGPCPPNCAEEWEYVTLGTPVRVGIHGNTLPALQVIPSDLLVK